MEGPPTGNAGEIGNNSTRRCGDPCGVDPSLLGTLPKPQVTPQPTENDVWPLNAPGQIQSSDTEESDEGETAWKLV